MKYLVFICLAITVVNKSFSESNVYEPVIYEPIVYYGDVDSIEVKTIGYGLGLNYDIDLDLRKETFDIEYERQDSLMKIKRYLGYSHCRYLFKDKVNILLFTSLINSLYIADALSKEQIDVCDQNVKNLVQCKITFYIKKWQYLYTKDFEPIVAYVTFSYIDILGKRYRSDIINPLLVSLESGTDELRHY